METSLRISMYFHPFSFVVVICIFAFSSLEFCLFFVFVRLSPASFVVLPVILPSAASFSVK